MKKTVIIVILFAVLLAMSSAYALWTDSVSLTVSANSAVTRLNYVGRNNPSMIDYTRQGGALSTSNPYFNIQETVYSLYPMSSSSNYTLVYTIENTGTVDVNFDGISISNIMYGTDAPSNRHQRILKSLRIKYTLYNPNATPQTYTYTVTDIYNHQADGVSFASMLNNYLAPGETCTLTVEYYRVSNGSIDFYYLTMQEIDTLVYSIR